MIAVVYHAFLVNDWKEIVTNQLKRLKDSGLYDACDILWCTVNLANKTEEEFNEVVKEYDKLKIEFHVNNSAEYPGIKKVKDLCAENPDLKVFYFHTKGVNNKHKTYYGNEISEEKISNIKAWKECLEYFLIDRWKECVDKLDEYDNVGVTCVNGWFWGNFWWSQTKHVNKTMEVKNHWTRWTYEAWMNDYVEGPIINYQFYHFNYNPYLTNIDEDWYKNPDKLKDAKIILHKALYGTPPFEIDEGYNNSKLDIVADVTNIVEKFLEKNEYKKFNVPVNNNSLGGDPVEGFRKFLRIEFSLDINPEKIYKIGVHEGSTLDLKF